MSRPCSVDSHPQRSDIDAAIVSGEPIRRIAGRFAVPESNLHRHKPHVRRQQPHGGSPMGETAAPVLDIPLQMRAINSAVLDALHTARGRGDVRAQVLAAGAVLRQLEFSHTLEQDAQVQELAARIAALEQALTVKKVDTERNGWSAV